MMNASPDHTALTGRRAASGSAQLDSYRQMLDRQ